MKRTVLPVLLAAVAGFFIRSAVASTPTVDPVMSFTGRITQAGGTPLPDGAQSIQVKVFDDASTGNLVCSSPVGGATVKDGRFTVSLQDCADKIATHNNLWAEVNVSSVPIGRTKVGAVPYAVEAQHADTATQATNATNATTAAACPTLATQVDGIGTSLGLLWTRHDALNAAVFEGSVAGLHVFAKGGNNGSVTCNEFCEREVHGPTTGTCVGARVTGGAAAGKYVACTTALGTANDTLCFCSRPINQ